MSVRPFHFEHAMLALRGANGEEMIFPTIRTPDRIWPQGKLCVERSDWKRHSVQPFQVFANPDEMQTLFGARRREEARHCFQTLGPRLTSEARLEKSEKKARSKFVI